MARLEDIQEPLRSHIADLECPSFENRPWVTGPELNKRRIVIISTAGLHRRDDRPFTLTPGDIYRIIPGNTGADELVSSHVSANFDRTGFQQDLNVVFPIDRLRELQRDKKVKSIADYHYSFMGALDPKTMEKDARNLAEILKKDNVDGILLIPV